MAATILLVDDEPSVANALERVLRKDGYAILKAANGEEALARLREHPETVLVVCDQRMPGMSGAELLRRVREAHGSVMRIALTGYADTETILACINEAGVHQFLLKPWDDEDLRATVREAVERRRMQEENERLQAAIAEQNVDLQLDSSRLKEEVRKRTRALEEARGRAERFADAVLHTLVRLIEMHDPGLRGHAARVADLAGRLADAAGCGPEERRVIVSAGLLHDIGKCGLPSSLGAKQPAEMNDRERALFEEHPRVAHELLKDLQGLEDMATIVRHHHESVSGKGFPDGLAGEAIPLGARILAVANLYDRYRYPPGEAVVGSTANARRVLAMSAGSRLDERLVRLFLDADVPLYTERGEEAVEVAQDALRPGMRLAGDVVNRLGKVLIRRQTVLTEEDIDHLNHNRGVDLLITRVFVTRDSLPEAPDEQAPETEDADAPEEEKRPLVVIVDDERHILNALQRELRSGGYDVEAFTRPVDALQQLRIEPKVHALVTDFSLPGVRGDRFLAQVQKEFPDLPCVVVTGYASRDTVAKLGSAVRVHRILPKPWDRKVLLETLAGLPVKG